MGQVSGTKSPGRNALCSCGSGKKFKRCCEGKRTIVSSGWAWKTGGLLAVAALVIVPLAVINANAGKSADESAGTSSPAAPSAFSQTPAAWEYDSVTDRHWNPQQGHWHQVPPPPQTIDFFSSQSQPAATGAGTGASGTTPAAWQYDPQTNRHWNPQHGHWHQGPPPPQTIDFFSSQSQPAAPGAGTGASGTTPAAWQYNPQTDRHWNPQHGHWHNGRPPPESQRPPP